MMHCWSWGEIIPHMASNENVRQNPGVCMVGHVRPSAAAPVIMKSRIGANRIIAMLSGEQLPRIC